MLRDALETLVGTDRRHPIVAEAYHQLGVLSMSADNHAAACEAFDKALALSNALYGREDLRTVPTRHQRANALAAAGRAQEAADELTGLLSECVSSLNESDAQLAWLKNDLGHVLIRLERYDQAIDVLTDSCSMWGNEHGHEREYLLARRSLAFAMSASGRPTAAQAILAETLNTQTTLSADDLVLLKLRADLAMCYHDQGDFQHALDELDRVLTKQTDILGAGHHDALCTMHWMAAVLQRLRRLPDAINVGERALTLREEYHRYPHTAMSTLLQYVASLYFQSATRSHSAAHLARAEELQARAFEMNCILYSPDNEQVHDTGSELAEMQILRGRYTDALTLCNRLMSQLRSDDPNTRRRLEARATVALFRLGNREAGRKKCRELKEELGQLEAHPMNAQVVHWCNVAQTLGDVGDDNVVVDLLQAVSHLAKNELGENHLDSLCVRCNYARALHARNDVDGARRQYESIIRSNADSVSFTDALTRQWELEGVQHGLDRYFRDVNNDDAARKACRTLVKLRNVFDFSWPHLADGFQLALADALYDRGEWEEAAWHYEALLSRLRDRNPAGIEPISIAWQIYCAFTLCASQDRAIDTWKKYLEPLFEVADDVLTDDERLVKARLLLEARVSSPRKSAERFSQGGCDPSPTHCKPNE